MAETPKEVLERIRETFAGIVARHGDGYLEMRVEDLKRVEEALAALDRLEVTEGYTSATKRGFWLNAVPGHLQHLLGDLPAALVTMKEPRDEH